MWSRISCLELCSWRCLTKQSLINKLVTFHGPVNLKMVDFQNNWVKIAKVLDIGKLEVSRNFHFQWQNALWKANLLMLRNMKIVSLIARLTELHFHDGRNGWTPDMIKWHQKLAWRLNRLVEEVQGLALCTISMHNLLHIHEDIINFSASDNVWCAVYERAVEEYVKKSHNGKNIEATLAHVESIREYSKSVEEKEQTSLGKHVLLVSLKLLTNSHSP